jgi:hypothetical protein
LRRWERPTPSSCGRELELGPSLCECLLLAYSVCSARSLGELLRQR